MAPTAPPSDSKLPKLRRLPSNARIQKRPILRPAIPHPDSAAPKIIYISTRTPFISAVKRARKLLSSIEKRRTQKISLASSKSNNKSSEKEILTHLATADDRAKTGQEEVVLKGVGRAIEKVLNMAMYFQKGGDVRVRIWTGGVGVVDDIVEVEKPTRKKKKQKKNGVMERDEGEEDVEMDEENGEGEEEELPETQVRKLSVVEVGISLL
ncbi:MAG: hypothetical protein LQ342_003615 [Letrouitia transgressa]|nr:MAG: hypothetical protein LQ342_003615 [Letrouitia transgressa]